MSTVAIGIDIVSVKRVRTLLENHRDRLLDTVFGSADTEGLLHHLCHFDTLTDAQLEQTCRILALKFAAKEAAVKVLGIPLRTAFEFKHLAIRGCHQFTVQLAPQLSQLAQSKSISRLVGSGSTNIGYAIATVIGERND